MGKMTVNDANSSFARNRDFQGSPARGDRIVTQDPVRGQDKYYDVHPVKQVDDILSRFISQQKGTARGKKGGGKKSKKRRDENSLNDTREVI